MSRIRTVKPEFWSSAQIMSCSTTARLLFIGMFNFSDDNGVHSASYVRLKAEIFPADNFTVGEIKSWVTELISNNLIIEYTVEDNHYWLITGFKNHQRIDKPTYRHPLPLHIINSKNALGTFANNSPNDPRVIVESSPTEGKGMECNGKEEDMLIVSDADATPTSCPHNEILYWYHEILPMLRPVREWNDLRQKYMRQRWREDSKRQNIEWWKSFFEYVKESKWLTGQIDGKDGRPPFVADLEWLIKPANFAKVVEGKYHE